MGMTRFYNLSPARILAICLYSEAKDKSYGTTEVAVAFNNHLKKGSFSNFINAVNYASSRDEIKTAIHNHIFSPDGDFKKFIHMTGHPNFPKLFAIATDFCSFIQRDKILCLCYDHARKIFDGDGQK